MKLYVQSLNMIKTINYLFVTCFGIGSLRFAPGTITSLVTTIFLYSLFHIVNLSSSIILLILFLVLPTSTYVALGFGILYGYLWLSTIPPTNGIISQVFGTKYLAMLYGIVFFSHQIGSFFGSFLGKNYFLGGSKYYPKK